VSNITCIYQDFNFVQDNPYYLNDQISFFFYMMVLKDALSINVDFMHCATPIHLFITPRFMALVDIYVMNSLRGYTKVNRKNNWNEKGVSLRSLLDTRQDKWARQPTYVFSTTYTFLPQHILFSPRHTFLPQHILAFHNTYFFA